MTCWCRRTKRCFCKNCKPTWVFPASHMSYLIRECSSPYRTISCLLYVLLIRALDHVESTILHHLLQLFIAYNFVQRRHTTEDIFLLAIYSNTWSSFYKWIACVFFSCILIDDAEFILVNAELACKQWLEVSDEYELAIYLNVISLVGRTHSKRHTHQI